ncbi:Hypothetical Protein FCC1311_036352 [Hondaea fermentalgiana]|uniref:ADP,ATP carrier protein n=1 Tax=Hondaea fermentalgiana TaxID=2315210 RepID=A0A2R5GHR1_9STRA|nr:Hypothetical Protein FCC1311_036352 [Hondaea fermentalgiana]|eukprot:GBG27414.1 Hypothetical Protein FCC1311_036352 [Hondaea fermentalgiana]
MLGGDEDSGSATPRPRRVLTPMARLVAKDFDASKRGGLDEGIAATAGDEFRVAAGAEAGKGQTADEGVAAQAAVRCMCLAFGALMAANYLLQAVRDAQIMFVGKANSSNLLTVSTMVSLVVGPFARAVGSVLAEVVLWQGIKVRFLLPLISLFLESAVQFLMMSARHAVKTHVADTDDANMRSTAADAGSAVAASAADDVRKTRIVDRWRKIAFESGADWLQGLHVLWSDRYHLWLGVYTVCYAGTLSLIYLERTVMAATSGLSVEEAASLSARLSLLASVFTFGLQVGLANKSIAQNLGMQAGLLAAPFVTLFGFAMLATGFIPGLTSVVCLELVRRVVAFGIAKPVRESLFAVMPRKVRFAAKSVLDTFVYRGAMGLGAMSFDLLAQSLVPYGMQMYFNPRNEVPDGL